MYRKVSRGGTKRVQRERPAEKYPEKGGKKTGLCGAQLLGNHCGQKLAWRAQEVWLERQPEVETPPLTTKLA